MLIILELEFDLCAIDTASLVDLLNSNFCTMLYSQTINCCASGYRANAADLKYSAICCCTAFACCCAFSLCLAFTSSCCCGRCGVRAAACG